MADLESPEVGMKFSQGKPRWSLLPPDEIEEVVKVLTEGAKKYKDNNWQKVDPKEYLDALGRHINAYRKGEKYDVGVDFNDFTPISFKEVKEKIEFQIANNVNLMYWVKS